MVGLDVSDRSIKVVEIAGGKTPKLRTVCWSALAPNIMRRGVILDVSLVAATIQEAMTKCSPVAIAGREVVVSIPETQSFVRVLDMPQLKESEMDEAVQWAIRHHIPFDLDRVYLDWQIVGPTADGARQQVLVAAAQRDVIDPLLQALDEVGLQTVALELEAQAIVRSILPQPATDVQGIIIIDLGATSTNIIFFDRGVMRFSTSIQRGGDNLTQRLAQELKLQPSIAAEKKALVGINDAEQDQAVADTLRSEAADLIGQIKKSTDEIAAQFQNQAPLRALLLCGGASNLPGLVEAFAAAYQGLPVELGNPLINMAAIDGNGVPPMSLADAVHFTTAIGLALRRADFA